MRPSPEESGTETGVLEGSERNKWEVKGVRGK